MNSLELCEAARGGMVPLCFFSVPAPVQERPHELSGLERSFWCRAADGRAGDPTRICFPLRCGGRPIPGADRTEGRRKNDSGAA